MILGFAYIARMGTRSSQKRVVPNQKVPIMCTALKQEGRQQYKIQLVNAKSANNGDG